jgi:hypothetical protein
MKFKLQKQARERAARQREAQIKKCSYTFTREGRARP